MFLKNIKLFPSISTLPFHAESLTWENDGCQIMLIKEDDKILGISEQNSKNTSKKVELTRIPEINSGFLN